MVISLPLRPSAWARFTAISRPKGPWRPLAFRGAGAVAAVVVALLAGGAGCATYEPRPLVPAEELGLLRERKLDTLAFERFAPGSERSGAAAVDLAGGLDEAELVAVALALNPSLRARRLELRETEALLASAGLWPNPEIGLTVRPSLDAASSAGIELDALLALLRPGEREARRLVARARLDAARAEVAALELRLVADARKARIAVLAARDNEDLLAREAALRAEAAVLVQQRRELGEATELDVALVLLERVQVERQVRETRAQTLEARRTLNELLGLPPSYELELARSAGDLACAAVEIPSDERLDERLLAGRFDLHAKEVRYREAEEELRLAIARQMPGLRIGPSFERDGEGSAALGLAAGIELPLFDRNQGEIAEKQAARERARAEYVAALHALRAAAFAARAELERAHTELEIQRREVLPLIERTETLFAGAFEARDVAVFEWLAARSRALEARRELLRAQVRQAAAAVDLEAVLGVASAAPVLPVTPVGLERWNQEQDDRR